MAPPVLTASCQLSCDSLWTCSHCSTFHESENHPWRVAVAASSVFGVAIAYVFRGDAHSIGLQDATRSFPSQGNRFTCSVISIGNVAGRLANPFGLQTFSKLVRRWLPPESQWRLVDGLCAQPLSRQMDPAVGKRSAADRSVDRRARRHALL